MYTLWYIHVNMAPRRIDRPRIDAAALELADEGGLSAVTARNLAERLEVTPMALYRHVPSLAVVVDGLLDKVLCEARILDHASTSLDAFLSETFGRIEACLREHPAVLPLLATRAGYGPSALGVVEGVLARLGAAGFPPAAAVRIFHVLLSYTLGASSLGAAMRARDEAPTRASFDGSPYVRASLSSLGRFGDERGFRSGLASIVASTLAAERVSSTNRRRPTSRRAT